MSNEAKKQEQVDVDGMFDILGTKHLGCMDDRTLTEEIDELLAKAARDLASDKATGKATITIKLEMEKGQDGNSVTAHHDVKYSAPSTRRTPVIGWLDKRGRLLTQAGKQLSLEGAVIDFAAINKEREK